MKIINIIQRGKYGSAKDKALTPESRKETYTQCRDAKDKVFYILGAYAGMRVGEMEQCRKDWVKRSSFSGKECLSITIPDECRNNHNKYEVWRPKTKNGRTTYIFDKELWIEVENFYNYNDDLGLTIRGIQSRCYRLTKTSVHSLRATAQNFLKYEMLFPAEVIAVLLGHKDVRTTMQHYNTLNRAQAESYLVQRYKEE